jgi:hypothetical protein
VWQDRTKFVAFVEREQTRIARLVYGFAWNS